MRSFYVQGRSIFKINLKWLVDGLPYCSTLHLGSRIAHRKILQKYGLMPFILEESLIKM